MGIWLVFHQTGVPIDIFMLLLWYIMATSLYSLYFFDLWNYDLWNYFHLVYYNDV